MTWNWQLENWPNFHFELELFAQFEQNYHEKSGLILGVLKYLQEEEIETIKIDILTQEAVSTSKIEGELILRDSVQSSIRKHLGLSTNSIKIPANAAGVAEMMVDVYLNFNQTLTHEILFNWHRMLTNGRRDLEAIGKYRIHLEPMQIVSDNMASPKIYFEAPPSGKIDSEMTNFINWYNTQIKSSIPTVIFAGLIHIYFESIHPFEDGNGRIGRALVEKAISQRKNNPSLNSFSKIIDLNKKEYYNAIQTCNHSLDANKWLLYFSKTLIQSQDYTISLVDFVISKTKFFIKFDKKLNDRQYKVVSRIFTAGLEGFKGGFSASNYKTITGTSNATATRDLQELVNIEAFYKTGELKSTRYHIILD
jgi:Fic family protein